MLVAVGLAKALAAKGARKQVRRVSANGLGTKPDYCQRPVSSKERLDLQDLLNCFPAERRSASR